MSSSTDNLLEEAVVDALELEPPHREAFLSNCLSHAPELLARALRLIKHAVSLDDFMRPTAHSGLRSKTAILVRDDRPSPSTFLGLTIDERYQVKRHLGSGAFGDVFKSYDTLSGELVALKILTGLDDPAQWAARRESSALRRVHSALIVSHRDLCDALGYPCIVTDYVDGQPFPAFKGRCNWDRASYLILRVLCAVSHMHACGIAHGDIKPSNVLVDGDDVRLIDFGLVTGEGVCAASGTILECAGTIAYMSPERLRGDPPSVSSDLYSIGVMLYEALTGEIPHRPVELDGLLSRRESGAPHLAPNKYKDTPRAGRELLMDLMAGDPRNRPNSARDVIAQLLPTMEASSAFCLHHASADSAHDAALKILNSCGDVEVLGPSGVGKSRLLQRLVRELRSCGRTCVELTGNVLDCSSGRSIVPPRIGCSDVVVIDDAECVPPQALSALRESLPHSLLLYASRTPLKCSASVSLKAMSRLDIHDSLSGNDRWTSHRKRASTLLYRSTRGNPRAVVAEMTIWKLSGWLCNRGEFVEVLPSVNQVIRAREPVCSPVSSAEPDPEDVDDAIVQGRTREAMDLALALVRSRRGADATSRYESLRRLFLCALAETSSNRFEPVLAELESGAAGGRELEYLYRMCRSAKLALQARGHHACALVDPDTLPEDPVLQLPWMSILLMAAWSLPLKQQEYVLSACERVADSVRGGQCKYQEGRGWYEYRQGRPREAAVFHERAAEFALTPSARLSCLLNEADARLDAGEHERARHVSTLALREAKLAGHVFRQARAEYIYRASGYRMMENLKVDTGLVSATKTLGRVNQAAMIFLVEAAVAWRGGEREACLQLSSDAQSIWAFLGQARASALAGALACVVGFSPYDVHDILAGTGAFVGPMWLLDVQSAALLALSGTQASTMYERALDAIKAHSSFDLSMRREVLSLGEAEAALRRILA